MDREELRIYVRDKIAFGLRVGFVSQADKNLLRGADVILTQGHVGDAFLDGILANQPSAREVPIDWEPELAQLLGAERVAKLQHAFPLMDKQKLFMLVVGRGTDVVSIIDSLMGGALL